MAGIITDLNRQVIPRWRSSLVTITRGELDPLKIETNTRYSVAQISREKHDWESSKSIATACDFVSIAYEMSLYDIAIPAARFLKDSPITPPIAKQIAISYLTKTSSFRDDDTDNTLHEKQIRTCKDILLKYCRNPLQWANMARSYTILGQFKKAEWAMKVALELAKDHRYILRIASRMYLHSHEDPHQAHLILDKSSIVNHDPWVLAAEIATASALNKSSSRIKLARKMVESGKFSSKHISELASALGTLEIVNGNTKTGKKLLSASLYDPTENAVAQAGWLERKDLLVIHQEDDRQMVSPEDQAWRAYGKGDWHNAMKYAVAWETDQPFSSRPSMLSSYIAAEATRQYELAYTIAERSLVSNPGDIVLMNNAAYARIMNGDLVNAKKWIDKFPISNSDLVLTATKGLYWYAYGDFNRGRQYYMESIEQASRSDKTRHAVAKIMFAIQETKISSIDAPKYRGDARTASEPFQEEVVVKLALAKLDELEAKLVVQNMDVVW